MIQIEIANAMGAAGAAGLGARRVSPAGGGVCKSRGRRQAAQGARWDYGYETLLLAEYALATKDTSVMPGLTRLSTDIARGASRLGTWGHFFARPDGILPGYGCMNMVGVSMTLAMVAAREAGVKDPDVDRTIAKSSEYLRWFVGKGCLPYGDTYPNPGGCHEDNGKNSCAAIIFDALGDREAASFFSRMATAGYAEREAGHTGNFFNMLWALPGVARCGPLATGAYWQETDWYYDLARGWDGRFLYQGSPASWGGHSLPGVGLHRCVHAGLRPAAEADHRDRPQAVGRSRVVARGGGRDHRRGARLQFLDHGKTPTWAATRKPCLPACRAGRPPCADVRRRRWAGGRATSCRDC